GGEPAEAAEQPERTLLRAIEAAARGRQRGERSLARRIGRVLLVDRDLLERLEVAALVGVAGRLEGPGARGLRERPERSLAERAALGRPPALPLDLLDCRRLTGLPALSLPHEARSVAEEREHERRARLSLPRAECEVRERLVRLRRGPVPRELPE